MSTPSNPGGLRLSTTPLTALGFTEREMHRVADWLQEATQITHRLLKQAQTLHGFNEELFQQLVQEDEHLHKLGLEVSSFSNISYY